MNNQELKALIKEFKKHQIDKPPLEIIKHYQEELRAIQLALGMISGKWKIQIIALLCSGEFRYSELEKGLPKISPRMLSRELKELEANELITRKAHSSAPVRVTYQLSDYGYTLVPIIIELTNWGMKHRKKKSPKN